MTIPVQPEQPEQEAFATHVERLVAEGKLTAVEAAELLEPVQEPTNAEPVSAGWSGTETGGSAVTLIKGSGHAEPSGQPVGHGAQAGTEVPPDLTLEVSGYGLQVVRDDSLAQPHLTANHDGVLRLQSGASGWKVSRNDSRGWGLKAVLSLPFMARDVRAEISGGNLTLPDISGLARIEVSGGNATLGRAGGLKAEVSGGNLTAGHVIGDLVLEVNGGNLSVRHSSALRAEINGGQLTWAGRLDAGQHTLEVNGGQATLHLDEGSSVQVRAESTLGGVSSSFPLQKTGGMMHAQYSGTLGGGEASLKCEVNAGQIRLVAGQAGAGQAGGGQS